MDLGNSWIVEAAFRGIIVGGTFGGGLAIIGWILSKIIYGNSSEEEEEKTEDNSTFDDTKEENDTPPNNRLTQLLAKNVFFIGTACWLLYIWATGDNTYLIIALALFLVSGFLLIRHGRGGKKQKVKNKEAQPKVAAEEQIKVKSQQEEIKPNLVKSEDEELASFPDASIIIEYDENASKLWNELKDLDKEIGFEFIENLEKDPKQDIRKLYDELERKFERKKLQQENPYADPKANKAFQEALQISEEAKDEFAKVYELMRDKLEPKQILEKVKTKHQKNNWRWK